MFRYYFKKKALTDLMTNNLKVIITQRVTFPELLQT